MQPQALSWRAPRSRQSATEGRRPPRTGCGHRPNARRAYYRNPHFRSRLLMRSYILRARACPSRSLAPIRKPEAAHRSATAAAPLRVLTNGCAAFQSIGMGYSHPFSREWAWGPDRLDLRRVLAGLSARAFAAPAFLFISRLRRTSRDACPRRRAESGNARHGAAGSRRGFGRPLKTCRSYVRRGIPLAVWAREASPDGAAMSGALARARGLCRNSQRAVRRINAAVARAGRGSAGVPPAPSLRVAGPSAGPRAPRGPAS